MRFTMRGLPGNLGQLRRCSSLPKPSSNHTAPSYNGPSYEAIMKIRKTNLNPCLTTFYRKPLLISSGHMQYLYDHEGNRYVDMFGGIVTVSVGHCHPKVIKAANEQMNKLWHTTNIYLHPKIHEYAEKLVEKMPGNLKVAYFVNSGSEANDLATLLARNYTQNFDVISLKNGYHGMSYHTMGLTANVNYKYKAQSGFGIHHAMNPDVYKGIWGGKSCRDSPIQAARSCTCGPLCEASDQYVGQVEDIIRHSIPKRSVAAFFAESIQGVGGTVQFPRTYIKKVAELIRKNGGLYVADEVQTGFGRTGEHFWGFQGHDVIPDIVTMAKGMGNGFPLAGVVTTPEIAASLAASSHFNTFGGNPVASAVGISVLEVIEEEKCQARSLELGGYFIEQLGKLRDEFECVGDVRGKGLMLGIEMVDDRSKKMPMNAEHFVDIWEDIRDNRVLIGRGGVDGNTFRIKPPMCISKDDVDYTVKVLRKAFKKHTDKV